MHAVGPYAISWYTIDGGLGDVDGAEVAKDIDSVAGIHSFGGLYIGAGKNLDPGTFWSGLIDDVRIYNRALRP